MKRLNIIAVLILILSVGASLRATSQSKTRSVASSTRTTIRVVDENAVAVPGAQVTILQAGKELATLFTDYVGDCRFQSSASGLYQVRVQKAGFYVLVLNNERLHASSLEVVLTHQKEIREEINVVESPPPIDPEEVPDTKRMTTAEIVNIPYPASRDIRNLLPFNPMVTQDVAGQLHLAGSRTFQSQFLLDGFNINSPGSGVLATRFSADAVRSINVQTTRYPVEYGKSSGGVVSFRTGMGTDQFRFNATNFIPSWQNKGGLTLDKWVPRATISGPLRRGKAWFFDGIEGEYANIVVPELPNGQNTNHFWRGSNLAKVQVNVTPANILLIGVLLDASTSPYDGISATAPQTSTTRRNTHSWISYIKDQHTFRNGSLLDVGLAGSGFYDGYEPHGDLPYTITPEGSAGSYFEALTSHSHRVQGKADFYLAPRQWFGTHNLKVGLDVDHVHFEQRSVRRPIDFVREDRTLLRRSTFPQPVALSRSNVEVGTYIQDRWSPAKPLLIESGLRFDWDQIIDRPLLSPRVALTYMLSEKSTTKLSAGIGIYYDRTQLEYIARGLQGPRIDQPFSTDDVTPSGPPVSTTFSLSSGLRAPRTINWSVGIERQLPAAISLRVNFLEKRQSDGFVFVPLNSASAVTGTFVLGNGRNDRFDGVEISASRVFANGYTLFGSYTRSSATTNAVLEYSPTLSILGPQGSGPLSWDTPNRVISWGWLPVPKTKRLDFVYALEWRSGFPFSAVNANQELVGVPNAHRFPTYFSFSPGLEWRFHVGKYHVGLRGVLENATDHSNPRGVNNVIDSPAYLTFSNVRGRTLTARIRLIGSK